MKNQSVVAIDGGPGRDTPDGKVVAANQKAVDALPLGSGTWRMDGTRGLYLRCRVESKSYFIQRRIRGELVKQTLGEMTLKEARAEAMRRWDAMRPKPAGGRKTFEEAFQEFMSDGGKRGHLADKTRVLHQYNLDHYLGEWKDRALEDIGEDEDCARVLYRQLKEKCGNATGYQVIRLISAVYNHARKVNRRLPGSPTEAVTLAPIKKRDWALSPDELKKWWRDVEIDKSGKQTIRGVSTLRPIKRAWWLTCLLTGARSNSISALAWPDVDLEKKTILFRTTKGDKPYVIPMSDRLAEILTKYRDSGDVPPERWVFPSPTKPGRHLIMVRDDKKGVTSAHHLRHTFRTTLAQLGATGDQARLLMGHSMKGDVSRGYITTALVIESLRPVTNAAGEHYFGILGW